MRFRSLLLLLLLLALSPAQASARPNQFQRMKQAVTARWIRTVDRLQQGVNARRIRTANVFRRIASGDAAGHRILFVDDKVTAFLSWTDPESPNFNPNA